MHQTLPEHLLCALSCTGHHGGKFGGCSPLQRGRNIEISDEMKAGWPREDRENVLWHVQAGRRPLLGGQEVMGALHGGVGRAQTGFESPPCGSVHFLLGDRWDSYGSGDIF